MNLQLSLQVGNGDHTAVAHGRLDLVKACLHIVMQRTGVGDIGVNAFLKAQLCGAAQIVPLPVPSPVGALAPVLLHIGAIDHDLR